MKTMTTHLRSRLLLSAGCFGAFFLVGCEKAVPRTDYFPLRDGNRWEYRLLDRPLLKRMGQGQAIVTAPLDADINPPANDNDAQLEPKAEVAETSPGEKAETKTASARRVKLELRAAGD